MNRFTPDNVSGFSAGTNFATSSAPVSPPILDRNGDGVVTFQDVTSSNGTLQVDSVDGTNGAINIRCTADHGDRDPATIDGTFFTLTYQHQPPPTPTPTPTGTLTATPTATITPTPTPLPGMTVVLDAYAECLDDATVSVNRFTPTNTGGFSAGTEFVTSSAPVSPPILDRNGDGVVTFQDVTSSNGTLQVDSVDGTNGTINIRCTADHGDRDPATIDGTFFTLTYQHQPPPTPTPTSTATPTPTSTDTPTATPTPSVTPTPTSTPTITPTPMPVASVGTWGLAALGLAIVLLMGWQLVRPRMGNTH